MNATAAAVPSPDVEPSPAEPCEPAPQAQPMGRRYLNNTGVPLSIAVFLATDTYDYDSQTISATSLLRPLRQLILADRVPASEALLDVAGLVQSRIGSAIHDGIERAWTENHEQALAALGIPPGQIKRIRVNPDPVADAEAIAAGEIIPVYTERRHYRDVTIEGPTGPVTLRISGKSDLICDGQLEDVKNTITYTYTHGSKREDQIAQGSIYRWLSPDLISADHIRILYLFSDWKAFKVNQEKNYPPSRIMAVKLPLMSLGETERFIREKLTRYLALKDLAQDQLPACTDAELWRGESVFKYYRNAEKTTGRSTKNFDSAAEAYERHAKDGRVGIVIEKPGTAKACNYCPAASICDQRAALAAAGELSE